MCGWNNKGQLGLGDTQDRPVLCHVQGLSSVRQVSCGWNHTLVIAGNTQCQRCCVVELPTSLDIYPHTGL